MSSASRSVFRGWPAKVIIIAAVTLIFLWTANSLRDSGGCPIRLTNRSNSEVTAQLVAGENDGTSRKVPPGLTVELGCLTEENESGFVIVIDQGEQKGRIPVLLNANQKAIGVTYQRP